jgi:hypothetical protein
LVLLREIKVRKETKETKENRVMQVKMEWMVCLHMIFE